MADLVKHDWRSHGAWRQGRTTTVRHMDLAIYIHMLFKSGEVDLEVQRVYRIGRGQHEFVFDDPHDIVSKLQVAYVNDRKAANLFAAQRDLKTIMREKAVERSGNR